MGSGGGFPGLPLAVVLPRRRAALVDSVGKKAASWTPPRPRCDRARAAAPRRAAARRSSALAERAEDLARRAGPSRGLGPGRGPRRRHGGRGGRARRCRCVGAAATWSPGSASASRASGPRQRRSRDARRIVPGGRRLAAADRATCRAAEQCRPAGPVAWSIDPQSRPHARSLSASANERRRASERRYVSASRFAT